MNILYRWTSNNNESISYGEKEGYSIVIKEDKPVICSNMAYFNLRMSGYSEKDLHEMQITEKLVLMSKPAEINL